MNRTWYSNIGYQFSIFGGIPITAQICIYHLVNDDARVTNNNLCLICALQFNWQIYMSEESRFTIYG